MGRKTFESIGKPLPNRTTIVLSRRSTGTPIAPDASLSPLPLQKGERPGKGAIQGVPPLSEVIILPGVPDLIGASATFAGRQIFICGGAQIYKETLPYCSDLYLTLVKREVEGDVLFPPFEDQFLLAAEIKDTPDFKILHYRARL